MDVDEAPRGVAFGAQSSGEASMDMSGSEEEDDDENALPAVLQHIHKGSYDSEGEDDEGEEEGEEEEGEGGDGPVPPSVPGAVDDDSTVVAHRMFTATAQPVEQLAPVSVSQVLADTTAEKPAAKRRRGKGARGRQGRGKGKGGKGKLPPDVGKLLGEANMCYVSQDFQQAIRMLEEVVRRAPRVSDPYHTLGLVYEEMDDQKRALECYLIAAYLTGKDVETWKRVATMSREQGLLQQAIYCINRALRLSPADVNAQYTRATVLVDLGQTKKGSDAYKTLLKLRPHDASVAAEMARLYSKSGESDGAIKVLQDCLAQNVALASGDVQDRYREREASEQAAEVPAKLPPSARGPLLDEDDEVEEGVGGSAAEGGGANGGGVRKPADPQQYLNAQLHLCNILAELYMSRAKFAETITAIEDLMTRGVCGDAPLPLDLAVKCGICKVYTAKPAAAEEQFTRLRAEKVADYADLYFDVAETLLAVNSHERALAFYEPLLEQAEYNQPAIWLKIGRCHLCMSRAGGDGEQDSAVALRYYTKVLKAVPANAEAAVAIASLHVAAQRQQSALVLLDKVYGQLVTATVTRPISLRADAAGSKPPARGPAGPSELTVPADCHGLQLLVERARLLHSFGRHNEFLSLVLVHIHRAIDALVPPPRAAREGGAERGRKRKGSGPARRDEGGDGSYPTLADVLTDGALIDLGLKAATIMARKQDYAAAHSTISGLLKCDGRNGKPAATEVAGASAGKESAALFPFIPSLDDTDPADDEDGAKRGRSLDKLRLLAVGVSYIRGDYSAAHAMIRSVCALKPASTVFWNLYMTISAQCADNSSFEKSHRFLVKLLVQHPDSVPLMMLVGHHCALTRNLGLGIAEYLRASSLRPQEPLIALCLGTSYLGQVMQKNTYNRHLVCLRAFTFLDKYAKLRCPVPRPIGSPSAPADPEEELAAARRKCLLAQEVSYNLGRAYHQINLLNLAVPYYEQTLELAVKHREEARELRRRVGGGAAAGGAEAGPAGLEREAAYNLFLIYRSHPGSQRLAREILREHLTI